MSPATRNKMSPRDLLVTRPDVPLPTPLEPASPRARGYPADPKPAHAVQDEELDNPDPAPRDVKYTA